MVASRPGPVPLVLADLCAALALMLVFEGILPFLDPARYRRILQGAVRQHDRTLRIVGLASMVGGVVLLYVVR
jgi:uncharacterized protein